MAITVTPKAKGNNPYISPDGLLDFKKLESLKGKVTKALTKFELPSKESKTKLVITMDVPNKARAKDVAGNGAPVIAGTKGKFTATYILTKGAKEAKSIIKAVTSNFVDGGFLKPTSALALGMKAKYEKFDAKKHRKGTMFTYLGRRCAKVAERNRITDKMNVLVSFFAKGVLDKALEKELGLVRKAFAAHTKASPAIKERIGKARGEVKDEKSVALDAAIAELTPLLGATVGEKNIVIGTSMMGQKTVFIKLPQSKQVVTIGLSDIGAMNKAKKLSSQSAGYDDKSDLDFDSESIGYTPAKKVTANAAVKQAEAKVASYEKHLARTKANVKKANPGTKARKQAEQDVKNNTAKLAAFKKVLVKAKAEAAKKLKSKSSLDLSDDSDLDFVAQRSESSKFVRA